MYCNKCGASLELDDRFCRACGSSTSSIHNLGKKDLWNDPSPSPAPEKKPSILLAENPKDNAPTTFIKKWGYRLVVLLAASVVMAIAKPLGTFFMEKYQGYNIWENSQKEVEKMKATMGLPKRLDEFTVMNDIFIKDRELHYDYIVNNINISNKTKSQVGTIALDSFNKSLCTNILITKYYGISVFTYKFPNGTLTYRFTKVDCRQN